MSLRTKTALTGLLALALGWAWLQSPPSGKAPMPKHPNQGDVRFVIKFSPAFEDGGPPGVPFSWSIGNVTDDGLATTPGREEVVAVAPAKSGQLAVLTAVPAKSGIEDGASVTPTVWCIMRRGDVEFARQPVHGWHGCHLVARVP